MMQGIQEERAKNSSGLGLGYFVGDNLEYSKDKQQKHSQQAKEIVGAAVGDKKSMSSAEVNDAVKKMSAASKISEEEARAFITGEISARKIDTPDSKSSKASKPTDTSSADKPKPDQIAEKPKPAGVDATRTAAAAVKAVYEKEGVKAATGVAYEQPSKEDATRFAEGVSHSRAASISAGRDGADPTIAYTRPAVSDGVDPAARAAGRANVASTTEYTRPMLDGPSVALAEEIRSSSRIGSGRESTPTSGRATEDVARIGGGLQGSPAGLGGIEQIVRQLTVQPAATGGAAGGNQEVRLTGTLSLNGLQEAMLAATSSRSVHIDGGAPIVKDPAPMMSAPGGSKNA
jgi:hypothetical protein